MKLTEPLGQGAVAVGMKGTVGHMSQAVAGYVNHAPAGMAEAGIKTDDPNATLGDRLFPYAFQGRCPWIP